MATSPIKISNLDATSIQTAINNNLQVPAARKDVNTWRFGVADLYNYIKIIIDQNKALGDAADADLLQRIIDNSSAIALEITNRINADANLQQQINALQGSIIYLGVIDLYTEQVTQEALTARATALGYTPLKNGYMLVDKGRQGPPTTNANDWVYNGTEWVNIGYYDIVTATNTSLGVVKGSTVDLDVSIRVDGTMFVAGLQGIIDNIYTELDNRQTREPIIINNLDSYNPNTSGLNVYEQTAVGVNGNGGTMFRISQANYIVESYYSYTTMFWHWDGTKWQSAQYYATQDWVNNYFKIKQPEIIKASHYNNNTLNFTYLDNQLSPGMSRDVVWDIAPDGSNMWANAGTITKICDDLNHTYVIQFYGGSTARPWYFFWNAANGVHNKRNILTEVDYDTLGVKFYSGIGSVTRFVRMFVTKGNPLTGGTYRRRNIAGQFKPLWDMGQSGYGHFSLKVGNGSQPLVFTGQFYTSFIGEVSTNVQPFFRATINSEGHAELWAKCYGNYGISMKAEFWGGDNDGEDYWEKDGKTISESPQSPYFMVNSFDDRISS